jgi:hypothetical protein
MTLTGEKLKYSEENLFSATESTSPQISHGLTWGYEYICHYIIYIKIHLTLTEVTVCVYSEHHPATFVLGSICFGGVLEIAKSDY